MGKSQTLVKDPGAGTRVCGFAVLAPRRKTNKLLDPNGPKSRGGESGSSGWSPEDALDRPGCQPPPHPNFTGAPLRPRLHFLAGSFLCRPVAPSPDIREGLHE